MSEFECKSSGYPVSEILEWRNSKRLELRPDFQRKAVWSDAANIKLVESILLGMPIPKVLLMGELRGQSTYRIVVDGQQRLGAILSYIDDGFSLKSPYKGESFGKKFSELDEKDRNKILNYSIDVNEIRNASDEVIRDIYHRLNKYTYALTSQEMRRADFPGDFLELSEELAQLAFFEDNRIFTMASSKRMADVEFTSELLILAIDGVQDKKKSLDKYYLDLASWKDVDKASAKKLFIDVIGDISLLFKGSLIELKKSRYRQKSDLYALFGAICLIRKKGGLLQASFLDGVRNDLKMLDSHISPSSQISFLSAYAIKCTSDANSIGSRNWRIKFLAHFCYAAYFSEPPPKDISMQMLLFWKDIEDSPEAIDIEVNLVDGVEVGMWENLDDHGIAWLTGDKPNFLNSWVFSISNGCPTGYCSNDSKNTFFV